MSVDIDRKLCNGCGSRAEGRCMTVCPGDLLYKDNTNHCRVRDPRDCWDCAACIKECPRQAIYMKLPVQIGSRGALLKARTQKGKLVWTLINPEGETEIFEIITQSIEEG